MSAFAALPRVVSALLGLTTIMPRSADLVIAAIRRLVQAR